MTSQLLASELGNLIQESKRKHNDLRQASEKSLEELKNLPDASEPNIGASLSQHANFVNPFIIACGTRSVKFTSIAIVCLQRLIAAKGVPRSRLDQVLQALREASSGGLDVQLRILQSLPSLLQNYATDISGDLLITPLSICFALLSIKNTIIVNTASATLQQLIISVFDKVAAEDKAKPQSQPVGEAPVRGGTVALHQAALDAYHIFNDICLLTESGRPQYLRFTSLSPTFGLELIESVLINHPAIFITHPEQAEVLRSLLMPFLSRSIVSKPNFPTAVRLVRVLFTILRKHMSLLPAESGEALSALSHVLDHDAVLWKRVLCLEAFKGIFSDPALVRQIYLLYDSKDDQKNILQDLLATFVRVSTEKPSVIGLGHQSTIPVAGFTGGGGSSADQAVLEASGISGIVTGAVTVEGNSTGISSDWSAIRTPCIDQLDKAEPLTIPDSYIFSLILACITSLSEGLAKFILPLAVPRESRAQKKALKQDARSNSPAVPRDDASSPAGPGLERSASLRKNPMPKNPLLLKDHPLHAEVKAYVDMIDRCWPAILATCSTFLYAALDSEYYHNLVRAFQRFTHVAGLLQLNTPRDAFLTTLGKAAVPPNVLTACLNAGARPKTPTSAGVDTPNTLFSNARGLLSVDSLTSQASGQDRTRQSSGDAAVMSINTRNLLCLRALLNLGIALGPTLESSWNIILETLQQADFVLFTSGKAAGRTLTVVRPADAQAEAEASKLLSNFGSEIKAVETAASRLFESTIDFPNSSFVEFVVATCSLLEKRPESPLPDDDLNTSTSKPAASAPRKASGPKPSDGGDSKKLKAPVVKHKRVMSITTAPGAGPGHAQEDQFVLSKLGELASLNIDRLLFNVPEVSGWTQLTSELTSTLGSALTAATVRQRAAETLVRFILEATSVVASQKEGIRGPIQLRLLEALRDSLAPLQRANRTGSITTQATDIDIHKVVLDGLKSLLEDSGESLVSGWGVVFEVIDSLFTENQLPSSASQDNGGSLETKEGVLATRSVRLIKPSFASLQLICSDFLSSLPNTCYLNLVNTLYKFCSQDDDLNVALTTVTFYWAISDFLHGRSSSMSIAAAMEGGSSDDALVKLANDTQHPGSGAALWMLLLLRLTAVTTDQRLELRNSAVQTLLRIIHAYGNSLTAEAWSVCIRSVIFRLLSSTEGRLRTASQRDTTKTGRTEWNETAVVITNGVSELLANYLDVLVSHPVFSSLWKELLDHFAILLDFRALDVSTAVFSSLGSILAKNHGRTRWHFDKKAVELAWDLWARGVPASPTSPVDPAQTALTAVKEGGSARGDDNQKCLVSWVNAFLEIERLMRDDMNLDKIQQAIRLLREAVLCASPGSFANDIEYMTSLQSQILEVFKVIRTDIHGAASAVITQLADFVSMAFDLVDTSPQRKRTFVAMSKASMLILHYQVTQHADGPEIYASGAFSKALDALAKPIALKYQFPITTKSIQPWKESINASLAILETTLPHLKEKSVPRAAFQESWDTVSKISNGIIAADLDSEDAPHDDQTIVNDQQFDIDSFHKLRELIIPALGAAAVAEKTRKSFVEGLFRISIVHPPSSADAAIIYRGRPGHSNGATSESTDSATAAVGDLSSLYKPGRGRTIDPPPTKRANMSYVCLNELFSLVATHDDSYDKPSIVVLPPTPRLAQTPLHRPTHSLSSVGPGDGSAADTEHARHVRLAQTAAPYLILRCALTIRSYVSDQALRGHMPQPLSQRRELSWILRSLVDLKSEPGAIPDLDGVDGEARKHLLRLYPLLIKASQVAGTAGDDKTLALVGEALEAVGAELGLEA